MPMDLGGVCTLQMPYQPRLGCAVGIDVGGTLLKGLALADGKVVHTCVADSLPIPSLEALLAALESVVTACRASLSAGAFALGIGWPGPVTPEGKVGIGTGRWSQIPQLQRADLEFLGTMLVSRCGSAVPQVAGAEPEAVADRADVTDLFIRKDAALEAYGIRVLAGPAPALVLNLGVNRVTGSSIDGEGQVRFEAPMELGYLVVGFGPGLPAPLPDAPPGALAQFVSRPGWLWQTRTSGLELKSWEQFAERIAAGDPAALATLEAVAGWLVEGLAESMRLLPVQRIYLSGGTMAGAVGTRLLAAVRAQAAQRPGMAAVSAPPLDPLFGGAFGAAHAANHAAQANRVKRELRGEIGGAFAGAIGAARMAQLHPYVCRAVLGTERPRAPLDRRGCVALLGRILQANDPKVSGRVVQLIREWLHPHLGEVLADQIEAAGRLGQQDLVRRLLVFQAMFQHAGVV
jgi:predicted NBD/HSP70 family sugar kinase